MATITLPTLSTAGYVMNDPGKMIDRILAYWYTTDELQDWLHRGQIECLSRIYSDAQSRINRFKALCEQSLTKVFSAYFSVLRVEVTPVDEIDNESKVRMIVSISLQFNGNPSTYQREVFGNKSVAVRVMQYINGEVE